MNIKHQITKKGDENSNAPAPELVVDDVPPAEELPEAAQEANPFEDLCEENETISFRLPGKKAMKVTLGDPGVSVFDVMRRVLSKGEAGVQEAIALCYVRQIDEMPVPALQNAADLAKIRKLLGNRGCMVVLAKWNKHFSVDDKDIPVIKKSASPVFGKSAS